MKAIRLSLLPLLPLLSLLPLLLLGCAVRAQDTPAAAPATAPPAAPAAVVPVPANITFLDSTLFDNMLSRELGKGHNQVEVEFSGKMSLNSIPPRVDKWITAVAEQGEVTLKPVDNSLKPKFVVALLPVVYSFFKQTSSERAVSAASKYNASVLYHVDKSSGESVIDRIVFVKKAD